MCLNIPHNIYVGLIYEKKYDNDKIFNYFFLNIVNILNLILNTLSKYFIMLKYKRAALDRMLKELIVFALFAYTVNSQAAVSASLAGGGFSFSAYTCASQWISVSMSMWANSSIDFYVFTPSYGSSCDTLNATLVQGPSLGPDILMVPSASTTKCIYVPSPSYCAGFSNSGASTSGWVATFTYRLSITCGCSPPRDSESMVVVDKVFENLNKLIDKLDSFSTNMLSNYVKQESVTQTTSDTKSTGESKDSTFIKAEKGSETIERRANAERYVRGA